MKNEKLKGILAKLEISIAIVLFVTMLFGAGMFINIKMNGKKSSLPSLSEIDKADILRNSATESSNFGDDLIEPTFVGIKNGKNMICACPNESSRRSIEVMLYDSLYRLFSGKSVEKKFESDGERNAYLETLKYAKQYVLIGFYSDIPSNVFIPCMSEKYSGNTEQNVFSVKNLFILPDSQGYLYAVAVSSDNDVTVIETETKDSFDKILSETYDINDGYSYFEYQDRYGIYPVLTSSFNVNKYSVSSMQSIYGKGKESVFTSRLFDIFGMNESLAREFTSKNNTEINFVEEGKELVIGDDGLVQFKTTVEGGVYLEEYLGFFPESKNGYTFGDKIFAVKKIVNKLFNDDSDMLYGIVGVDYNKDTSALSVYLKCFVDGILLSDKGYDAVFDIQGDTLVGAKVYAKTVQRLDEMSLVLPQKYSNLISEKGEGEVYALLCPDNDDNDAAYSLTWTKISNKRQVDN